MTAATIAYALLFCGASLVFAGGLAYRIYDYARTPAPLKIPTTPAPTTQRGVALRLAREVVLFESLFKSSLWTWVFGWLFHAGLALVLIRHLRYFTEPVWGWVAFAQPFGIYAAFAMAAGLAGLWVRRFAVARVRYISTPSDHLMLALLLAIAVSGLAMKYLAHTDVVAVKAFFLGLMVADWQPLPADGVLYVHLALVALLMLIFPFSKLLHAPGLFFSPTRNQADNPREKRHLSAGPRSRARMSYATSRRRACRAESSPHAHAFAAPGGAQRPSGGRAGAEMAAEVKAPPLREFPGAPQALLPGAMAASKPYVATDKMQQAIGFPGELADDWQEKALGKMGELLGKYRSLKVYMDSCVHCGACADKCHYFIGTQDPLNMPVARQDLMRSVYRRHFTVAGKLFPKLVGARELTKGVLDQWYTYYNQCSECRRCSVFCPYGIDTAEITMAAKEIMDSVGYGQKYSNEIIGKVHRIGNNLGLPGPALANTLEGLEEDVKEETGADVRFPLDEKGAEVLLVTPSADFFAEPHVDSLIGYAKVFHAAGIRWTLSSHASEAGNFGLFIGSYEQLQKIALRIREAALELGVKRIVVGECGHAWRVAYSMWNTLAGIGAGATDPFAKALQSQLDPRYRQPMHICELTWDLIERGALTLDREANDHRVVTFHDSCNVARASRMGDTPGGQFEIPRAIIRAVANRYVEMRPGTTREATFCCGGGGGLLTDELLDLRVKGALPRMEALRQVADRDGVNFMATICAICKAQFTKVLPYYGFKMGMVGGIHQLVSTAIRLSPKQ